MEKEALEIIRAILKMIDEREVLLEELAITKGLLDSAINAQETMQKCVERSRNEKNKSCD